MRYCGVIGCEVHGANSRPHGGQHRPVCSSQCIAQGCQPGVALPGAELHHREAVGAVRGRRRISRRRPQHRRRARPLASHKGNSPARPASVTAAPSAVVLLVAHRLQQRERFAETTELVAPREDRTTYKSGAFWPTTGVLAIEKMASLRQGNGPVASNSSSALAEGSPLRRMISSLSQAHQRRDDCQVRCPEAARRQRLRMVDQSVDQKIATDSFGWSCPSNDVCMRPLPGSEPSFR